MYKVGICGHYGIGEELLNGQTIKTKMLTEELLNVLGDKSIKTVDSHNWKENPIKLIIECYFLCKNCKNIIILPASRGVNFFIPIFLILNRLFHRKIHYVVIGGWLQEHIKKHNNLKRQLKKLDGIYVETISMINELNKLNINNVYHFPNFKKLKIINKGNLVYSHNEPYKLCTFSRVILEKGIEDAIYAVNSVNSKYGRNIFSLDIYGQIDPMYNEQFKSVQKRFPSSIKYRGEVEFNKSVEVLKNYSALLFPTKYKTEGIPGTIIDAYAAGIPVISSRWNNFNEVIDDKVTGLGYEFNNREALEKLLFNTSKDISILDNMKVDCMIKGKQYQPEKIITNFISYLDLR